MDTPELVEGQFGHGGHKDRLDNRDYDWRELGAALPPFDWQKGYDVEAELSTVLNQPGFKLPVKNQDGSGSCGGQAWSYLGEVIEAFNKKAFAERSAKFIYSQTYQPGGGSYGRDNCIVVEGQGWGDEALTPSYDNGNPPSEAFMERPQDITQQARQTAQASLALNYANVAPDIDLLAQAIQANHGLVVGMNGTNNGTWLNPEPVPPNGTDTMWGHWLFAGKALLVNGVKKIFFLNSWGPNVGVGGWQTISQGYYGTPYLWQGWTMTPKVPVTPGTFTHNFQVDMKFGDQSPEVLALQQALQIDGEFPASVAPTGFFGNITRNAVEQFQFKYSVASAVELNQLQGKLVGPKTRTALNALFNK